MRLRILPVLVAMAAGLVASMPIEPPSVRGIGPVPECRIDDIYTVPRGYDDWSVTLVDWLLRVEDDYVPPDLVPVSETGLPGGGMIREVAVDDTREMGEAAAAAGAPIGVWSPYRSHEEQVQIFTGYSNQFGYEDAITYSARPGHSEHQLGLGVDFMSAGEGSPLQGDWATTPAGAWMRDNSWKYGWVNSYPLGPPENPLWNEGACFHYEPWHYRYLGREVAAAVHESGLTIREYLWTNYTMVDPETGQALATPTPSPSATPSPSPSPSPGTSSTASPSARPPSEGPTASASASAEPSSPTGILDLDGPILAGFGLAAAVLLIVPIVVAARRRG